ncbi:MAG: aspartate/methionine/tyrosine aminotransferase [Candidatus Azotimanducaceae bacterium]|jgi:aspartate/methionine/tyrosine aminotransferase
MPTQFSELSMDQLHDFRESFQSQYQDFKEQKLNLDLTRGKPAAEQLDLANDLDGILHGFYLLQDGTDVRNYGGILGIPEARALGGELLDLPANEIMVGGNSSLSLMYQYIAHMLKSSWQEEADKANEKIKFLCPVPGYDRHFAICEHFEIEMICIPMNEDGPGIDAILEQVKSDPMIKGIWCVPKYSNPGGQTYSDSVVKSLASLTEIAPDNFRIMWDNAYAVHHLSESEDKLSNLMDAARAVSSTDKIVYLGSTSKITFAGAGISFIGLSEPNLKKFELFLSASTIGADKVNQLRHVRFLKNAEGIRDHMNKHKEIIKPRFTLVQEILQEALGEIGIASWTNPKGGYFVSLDTMPGLASKVVSMAGEVGVKLTPAGATFPYGLDPHDQNIRIAPTYPSLAALKQALMVFVVCLKLATLDSIINSHEEREHKEH